MRFRERIGRTSVIALSLLLLGCDTLSIYQDSKTFTGPYRSSPQDDLTFINVEKTSVVEVTASTRRFNFAIGTRLNIHNLSNRVVKIKPGQITMRSEIKDTKLPLSEVGFIVGKKYTKILTTDFLEIRPKATLVLSYQWDGSVVMGFTHLSDSPAQHKLVLNVDGLYIDGKKLPASSITLRDK